MKKVYTFFSLVTEKPSLGFTIGNSIPAQSACVKALSMLTQSPTLDYHNLLFGRYNSVYRDPTQKQVLVVQPDSLWAYRP